MSTKADKKQRGIPGKQALPMVGYCRVSTAAQEQNGVSLAEQAHRLKAAAEAHGFQLATVVDDPAVSGATAPERRPGLSRVLAMLRQGKASGVVVTKLDRLSRSVRDTLGLVEEAERRGWRIVSLGESLDTGTASGRLVLNILSCLGQWQREEIGERTTAGMEQVAREGRARSRWVPFGWRLEGLPDALEVPAGCRAQLVPHEAERAILARLAKLDAKGLGASRIAQAMNADGGKNPRTGRPWNRGTIAALLRTAASRAEILDA